jgi:HD-like signal output (HDOD) protein
MSKYPGARELIDDLAQMVSLPEVYYRLEELIDDPDASIDDIAAVVCADPDLAFRLLGLANSSLFAFPAQVETVSRAVTLIGTRQLRDLVLATLVVRQFSGLPIGVVDMQQFWRHSLGTAVICRSFAIWRRERNVERFYLIGLLHDLGRLLLFLKLPDAMSKLLLAARESSASLFELEREEFGYDHASLGGLLMDDWSLPQSVCRPIAAHHAPQRGEGYASDASLLHLADLCVNALQWGSSGQPCVPRLIEKAWEMAELDEAALGDIVERARQQYEDSVTLFLRG